MPSRHQLRKLLQIPGIGAAARGVRRRRGLLPTGFADLDRALAGGWPLGALIELLVEPYGVGEFRLLLPALQALGGDRRILLVAPPYIPYAPAFMRHGLDVSRILVVRCRRHDDVLWTVEQALRSGACAAVLAWPVRADVRALRRLQLAAERSDCWVVLFRPPQSGVQRSPAVLRVTLRPGGRSGLQVHILKYHGGRPRSVSVDIGAG